MQETKNHKRPGAATFCCVGINVVLVPTLLKNAEHSSSSLSTCRKEQYMNLQYAAKEVVLEINQSKVSVGNKLQELFSISWYPTNSASS